MSSGGLHRGLRPRPGLDLREDDRLYPGERHRDRHGAPRGTKLYERLVREKRLLASSSGDNTDLSMNFVPAMTYEKLLGGYRQIIETIYSPKHYYRRVKRFLQDFHPVQQKVVQMRYSYWKAGLKSIFVLGLLDRERFYYWRLVFWSLFRRPRLLPLAVTFSIYGFHFRKIFARHFERMERETMGQA